MERKLGNQIGQGKFGCVYTLHDSPHFVVKKVKHSSQRVHVEYENLRRINHPHVLQVCHVLREGSFLYMKFPRYSCTLRHLIPRHGMDVWIVGVYMRQLSSALAHCHQMQLMHRDIKPDNIFVDLVVGTVVLGDFGMSKSWTLHQRTHSFPVCSPSYRAPELLLDKRRDYDEKMDVWSLGCVYAEMLLGHPLFCGETELELERVVRRGVPHQLKKIPPEDAPVWQEMMHVDPRKRCSAQAASYAWMIVDDSRWSCFFSTQF